MKWDAEWAWYLLKHWVSSCLKLKGHIKKVHTHTLLTWGPEAKVDTTHDKEMLWKIKKKFSFFSPTHTSVFRRHPFEGQCHRHKKKGEKGKIQIWKNMCNIKVYGRTILFCVHVSLLSEMDTWTRRRCKKRILSGHFPFAGKKKTPKRFFLRFYRFYFGGHKSFSNKPDLTPRPPLRSPHPPHGSHFITLPKFIFPWISFLLFIFIKFCKRRWEASDCWNMFQGSRGKQ